MNTIIKLHDRVGSMPENFRIRNGKLIKSKVTAYCTDTGEVLFKRSNITTIAGGAFLARALFDFKANSGEITPSYNNALNLENTTNTTTMTSPNKAYLFCVGIDGCGREASQVIAEKYASWINPTTGIVPFQYCPSGDDLNEVERGIYFGRKVIADKVAYYFKKFDADPVFTQQLTDGTPIDSTIYDMNTTLDAQTMVTVQLSITKADTRDFFINTTGINDARINALSLCTAWYNTKDKHTYYQDIRPCTLLHFPNEALIDTEKSITFLYTLYFN